MPKPISELRASGRVRQPTITHTICLDVDLADEYRTLRDQLLDAVQAVEDARAEDAKKKQRLGSKGPVDSAKTKAARKLAEERGTELDAKADEMAEFEIEVTVERSIPEKWNDWCAEHPPREQEPDEAGRRALVLRDSQHGGRCDFDALVKDLPNWVTEISGEQAIPDDWDWLVSKVGPQDLDDLADVVLNLQGSRVRPPKPVATSLSTALDAMDSSSPEPGE